MSIVFSPVLRDPAFRNIKTASFQPSVKVDSVKVDFTVTGTWAKFALKKQFLRPKQLQRGSKNLGNSFSQESLNSV